jgi:hypothetical protein
MSVLKSIFHRYNKTAKDYDTLHPETEHAQVTDFGQGVIAHLASNVLTSTISSITSDSLMAKLVKLVFNATGVQYNIAQNGYVKFGDLFGGLIIQWGFPYCSSNRLAVTFPIGFNALLSIIESHKSDTLSDFKTATIVNPNETGFTINTNIDGYVFYYIAFGM